MTNDRITQNSGDAVREVLRAYGWKCGPEFDKRYYSDPWVFNLVNIIEKQAEVLSKVQEALDSDRTDSGTLLFIESALRGQPEELLLRAAAIKGTELNLG